MKKHNVNILWRLCALLIYALVPVFPFYAMTAVKDVIFGAFVIMYIMLLYDFIKNDLSLKKMIISILIIMGMFLFRNNGIYVFVLSFPFLLIKNKKNFLKLA